MTVRPAAPDYGVPVTARLASVLEQLGEPALKCQELDRLPLELALEALVRLEHRPRARAVGAVVQIHHVRIEQEELLHVSATCARQSARP